MRPYSDGWMYLEIVYTYSQLSFHNGDDTMHNHSAIHIIIHEWLNDLICMNVCMYV